MAVTHFSRPLEEFTFELSYPSREGVTLKVGGAGMCRTDLRLWVGKEPRPGFKLPFVLGHENAGYIDELGEDVPENFKKNDAVVVYSVWGDLTCSSCRDGKYMLCKDQKIPGQSYYFGGYSEYMEVPSYRFLVKLDDLDPADAAPLADAGVTSLSAVRKSLPLLIPGSVVIAYGVGGLASYGIQFLKLLSPTSTVVAVSRSKEKLEWAMSLGADYTTAPDGLEDIVANLSRGSGSSAAIDFVGTEESTTRIAPCLGVGGVLVEVGMEGEKLSLPTFGTTVWQWQLIGSNYGTFNELVQTVDLVKTGKIKSHLTKVRLREANEALMGLQKGTVLGRYVLIP